MANILDYLDWRGDLTLAERGFNEVDNLLMAELCFLDFSGIVPADFSAPVSLPEAMQKYERQGRRRRWACSCRSRSRSWGTKWPRAAAFPI